MSYLFRLASLLFIVKIALASKTFAPNCTIPAEKVNLVLSPPVRGTFDILWSCILTLLLCTWTIQHPNIPGQRPKEIKTCWDGVVDLFSGKGSRTLRAAVWWVLRGRVWRKVKWMVIGLILPELFLGLALQDLMLARKSCREMKQYAEDDGVEWTMTHAYFANMGGFVLQVGGSSSSTLAQGVELSSLSPNNERGQNPDPGTESNEDGQSKSNTHAPDELENGPPSESPHGDPKNYYLTAEDLHKARREKLIPKLPKISAEEIQDRSKGDAFIKGTAIFQVSWLLIQVAVRASKHLPVSQLEIAVLAYSVCAFVTYLLYWMKPQDVTVPIYISGTGPLRGRRRFQWSVHMLPQGLSQIHGDPDIMDPVPNDFENRHHLLLKCISYVDQGIVVASVGFGALHCLAWDFDFPHPVERLLWRISSVSSTLALPAFYAMTIIQAQEPDMVLCPFIAMALFASLSALSYFPARLFLVVESFRTLFFLPPEAFIATWSTQFPHIG